MIPEHNPPGASFALLSSGASFSCDVLQALNRHRYRPELLVLPEYPPAPKSAHSARDILGASPQRRLLTLAAGIDIAYAPAQRQVECARLIERRAIDFLLVACWPYLIESSLIESARKDALNLHPSLLPRFRGPDPIGEQLAAGDSEFGVSLHRLNQRFDQGDIIAQQALSDPGVNPERSTLEKRCARLGVELFIDAVTRFPAWNPIEQACQTLEADW